jgi:hypothetical protein
VFDLPLSSQVKQFEGRHVGVIGPSALRKNSLGLDSMGSFIGWEPVKTTFIDWDSTNAGLQSIFKVGKQLKAAIKVCNDVTSIVGFTYILEHFVLSIVYLLLLY